MIRIAVVDDENVMFDIVESSHIQRIDFSGSDRFGSEVSVYVDYDGLANMNWRLEEARDFIGDPPWELVVIQADQIINRYRDMYPNGMTPVDKDWMLRFSKHGPVVWHRVDKHEYLGAQNVEPFEAYEYVDHPPHYNGHPAEVECIDVIEHACFNVGVAIKHLWRAEWGNKPGADREEDLRKAIWYLERELDKS